MVRLEWSRLLWGVARTHVAILLLASMGLGQSRPQVDFDRIDLSEVAGSRQISSIVQDRRGFMWFGTGNGLVRYDGSRAKVFRHDPTRPDHSLAHDQVWELFVDQGGLLWIGTDDGISIFDPVHETFTTLREERGGSGGLKGSIFLAIAQLEDGRMLLGSRSGGLNLYDPAAGGFRHFEHDPQDPHSLPYGRVQAILVDEHGVPWVAGSEGVARFDPGSSGFHRVPPKLPNRPGLKDKPVRELLVDSQGRFWVGFHSGLALLDRETETLSWFGERGQGPLIRGRIYGLAEDMLGRLWVARYNGDLILLDRNLSILDRFHRRLGVASSLPSSLLDVLFLDRTGVLWIGTFGGGVAKHVPNPNNMRSFVHHPDEPNSLGPGKVNDVLLEEDGTMLVGGMSGIRRLDKEGVFHDILLPIDSAIHVAYEVKHLAQGEGDNFWAAGARGLFEISHAGETLSMEWWNARAGELFGGGFVTDLLWDRERGLWIATDRGLYLRYEDGESYRRFVHAEDDPNSLSHDHVRKLVLGPDGAVWVGTEHGVDLFDPESGGFKRFALQVGDDSTNWLVSGILPQADGEVWAIAREGVARMEVGADRFELLPSPPGPGAWVPRFLLQTLDGELLVGFLEGLKMFDPETLRYDSRIMRPESRYDHFLSENAVIRDDGRILIPSQGGIFVLDPSDFPERRPMPPVVLTDIHMNHRTLGSASLMDDLVFEHDRNHLSFRYAALDFGSEVPQRFEVWLEGLEDHWVEVGEDTEVSYPYLDPGHYAFHVRLAGTEGLGDAMMASKEFRIRQPFWRSTWFKVLVVGMVFFSGWAVQRYRGARVRRRNLELESLHRRMTSESKRRQTMQENLAITLDSIADGVISMDGDLKVLAVNPVGAALTGWLAPDAVGRAIDEVFVVRDLETREVVNNPRRWLRADPDRMTAPVRALLKSASGEEYLVAVSVAAMRRPTGESYGTVLVFRDITDRAALEAQLAQAQKMESLGRLAGGIAHDFNNLLTSIQGYADLVRMDVERRGAEGGRSREYIDAVLRSSKRGADLVGQLLAFSRRSEAETEELDMHVILAQAVEMLQRTLDPAIAISVDDAVDHAVVEASGSLLINVFLNLGINAGDAMQEGGKLVFRTRHQEIREGDPACGDGLQVGTYLSILVEDTGAGMTEAMRERIFEPFFTTKDLGDGTGLGLPTALGTVHSFGGTIQVETSPGKGTTMNVLLPLASREAHPVEVPAKAGPARGKGNILLIEDDEAVMELCETFLTSLGYVVLLAKEGRTGIEIFFEERDGIDLVIADYLMPQCNGVEVVRRIRQSGSEVPVMMITGFSLGVSHEEILAEGVDAVLAKPFLPVELAEKVEGLLRNAVPRAHSQG